MIIKTHFKDWFDEFSKLRNIRVYVERAGNLGRMTLIRACFNNHNQILQDSFIRFVCLRFYGGAITFRWSMKEYFCGGYNFDIDTYSIFVTQNEIICR